MSFNFKLESLIKERNSCLCVGLDISPESLGSSNISNLKKHSFDVVDMTRDLAIAYKPNFAFFERWGAAGFAWLEEIISYIGNEHILIADAKRGDIGNTAKQYAMSIFDHFNFDAVFHFVISLFLVIVDLLVCPFAINGIIFHVLPVSTTLLCAKLYVA